MTPLKKSVTRLTGIRDWKGNQLVCTLLEHDLISFRAKGKRRVVTVHLGFCAQLAQAYTMQSDYDKKQQEYHAKRKAGYRGIRKPKRPFAPFGRIIMETLRKG